MSALTFGSRLREERKRLGLTQAAFAERAGVAVNSQTNYELDGTNPRVKYFDVIAALGVDVGYVLTGQRPSARGDSLPTVEDIREAHGILQFLADATAAPHDPVSFVERLSRYALAPQLQCRYCQHLHHAPWISNLADLLSRLTTAANAHRSSHLSGDANAHRVAASCLSSNKRTA